MAAYAALASLMNNIEQMMKHPHLSKSFDKKQIEALLKKSGSLLDIIEGNKYGGGGSREAEDFERQITCAAHAAEDIIESHIVDQIHAGSSHNHDGSSDDATDEDVRDKDVDDAESFDDATDEDDVQIHSSMVDLERIIEDMEVVMVKSDEIMKIERDEQPTHSTVLPLMESTGEPSPAMVGLDDELTHLLDELTGHQSNRHTISIVGMGGMGKTTLARNLYANPLIIEHFDVRVWATVSQQHNEKEILKQLLSSLGKLSDGSVGELGERLYKSLIGRRYLVILDDIWSVEAWDRVRHYFPDDGRSSRVVLTTRLSNVASACGSSCFNMNLLDEGKSWKLFCEKASFPHKDDPLELGDIGKRVVRLCKGLALSIVVIGGLLLRSPRTVLHWENVAKDLESSTPNSEEKNHSIDVLSLSYKHLPPHLKPCFLYLGYFKEDSVIRVSTITRLWVAEGFIRPSGTRVLEEIAESCLKDLIDRNLIFVSKRRFNGNIGSCGIHDLLRDLCVKVAEEQEFFHVREDGGIRSTDRRVICDPKDRYIRSQVARSILTRSVCADSIKCKLLRVLADEENTIADPPADVLYRNVNLRYLAYQNRCDTQDTWELPISLTLIWNLQTLIVSPYYISYRLAVAPSKIWRMQQLRHIKFPKLYLHSPSGREDVLENFQTLATAVNLKLSEKMCKIIPNINMLGLLYDSDLDGYDDSLVECLRNLDRLLNLESLKMDMALPDDDYHDLHTKLAFPRSLRKLSLTGCELRWDDLSMIGSLPQLHVLHLKDYSVTEGKQWSPNSGHFRHLKSLKIETCELFKWDADNSHFPVLEKLALFGLDRLEEIPLDIGDISTLGLIRVEYCSLSAAISAMRIKEYQQDFDDNNALQIQIQVFPSEQESFMKMVEAEQLTLSSIQFETLKRM